MSENPGESRDATGAGRAHGRTPGQPPWPGRLRVLGFYADGYDSFPLRPAENTTVEPSDDQPNSRRNGVGAT